MGLIVVNFIACLIIEKLIVPRCNRIWRNYRMNKLSRQLELDTDKKADLNMINTVKIILENKRV